MDIFVIPVDISVWYSSIYISRPPLAGQFGLAATKLDKRGPVRIRPLKIILAYLFAGTRSSSRLSNAFPITCFERSFPDPSQNLNNSSPPTQGGICHEFEIPVARCNSSQLPMLSVVGSGSGSYRSQALRHHMPREETRPMASQVPASSFNCEVEGAGYSARPWLHILRGRLVNYRRHILVLISRRRRNGQDVVLNTTRSQMV